MGYRSRVAISLSDAAVETIKSAIKLDKNLRELVNDSEEPTLDHGRIYFSDIKWYEGYPEIDAMENFLSQLDEEDYGFIRIGEDYEDVEEKGEPYTYEMYVSREIEW